MKVTPTIIDGAFIVEPSVFQDERGFFYESFNLDKILGSGLPLHFPQDNHSRSAKGVLRGLHFQLPPKPMGKLVRCIRGRVWDVAVDLRPNSPTFKQYIGHELSEDNKLMLFVPAGCAHGFYSITDNELLYKCTDTYDKALDMNVRWNDPAFGIDWPLDGAPIISDRDQTAPMLSELTQHLAKF